MRDAFYAYLVAKGYKEYAPCGRKSTVYSYCNRIDLISDLEGMTWEELATNIDSVLPKYDVGGPHEDIGKKSNRTGINALRAFAEFAHQ